MQNVALFPLHTVLFPGMVLPLHIFEPRYRRMVHACLSEETPFGVVLIRAGREVGGPSVPYTVGTLARIRRVEHMPDSRMNIEAVGEERFRLEELYATEDEVQRGRVTAFPLAQPEQPDAHAAARAFRPWLARYLDLLAKTASTQFAEKPLPPDPAGLAYLGAIVVQVPMSEKQALLSVETASQLLSIERALFRRETSLMRAMLDSHPQNTRQRYCSN